jgi:hypothetical protein
VIGI